MKSRFDNNMAWDLGPGHYEVWYLTLAHRESGTGFWIRYTLESPDVNTGRAYAQLWFARGDHGRPERTFGFNRRFPIESLIPRRDPFELRIGDAVLTNQSLRGALAGDGHDVTWDLRFVPASCTHYHLPDFAYLRRGTLVDTVVFSPNLSIALTGTITVDGETYDLRGSPGGQTHLYGRKHAYAWAWAHCNAFDSGEGHEAAVMEALTVQLRRGPVLLPQMTLVTVYPDGLGGEALSFNKVVNLPRNRAEYGTGYYRLVGEGVTAKAEVALSCRPEDMVRAEYVDPDGEPAYCHNTVVARCEVKLSRRSFPGADWQPWRTLATDHGASFEWAGRAGDSQVRQHHVALPL